MFCRNLLAFPLALWGAAAAFGSQGMEAVVCRETEMALESFGGKASSVSMERGRGIWIIPDMSNDAQLYVSSTADPEAGIVGWIDRDAASWPDGTAIPGSTVEPSEPAVQTATAAQEKKEKPGKGKAGRKSKRVKKSKSASAGVQVAKAGAAEKPTAVAKPAAPAPSVHPPFDSRPSASSGHGSGPSVVTEAPTTPSGSVAICRGASSGRTEGGDSAKVTRTEDETSIEARPLGRTVATVGESVPAAEKGIPELLLGLVTDARITDYARTVAREPNLSREEKVMALKIFHKYLQDQRARLATSGNEAGRAALQRQSEDLLANLASLQAKPKAKSSAGSAKKAAGKKGARVAQSKPGAPAKKAPGTA